MRRLVFGISKNARLEHTNEGGNVWGMGRIVLVCGRRITNAYSMIKSK